MASRAVIIVGNPRSGTSCVAGALHKAGIDMGAGHFQPDDRFNPRGYYEDLRWRMLNQRVTGKGYSLRAKDVQGVGKRLRADWRALACECAVKPLWGFKDPWVCFLGRFIWPVLEGIDVRIVAVNRDLEAAVASVHRHLTTTYKGRYSYDARTIVYTWDAARRATLEAWGGPIAYIQYEDLVRAPMTILPGLVDWCYEGTGQINTADLQAIAQWVTPGLKHF